MWGRAGPTPPSDKTPTGSRPRRLLKAALVGYLLVLLMLTAFQERLIFPATRDPSREVAGPEFEFRDVYFPTEDGIQLHGRYYATDRPRGHLLYFHGNGDMVGWLDGYACLLRDEYGLNVFLFDYRGYGRSDGKPTGPGVLVDGRAALAQCCELCGVSSREIVYMGRSLGGAVAIDLACEHPPKALILQNTFSSLADVASYHYPWLPVRTLLRVNIDSINQIDKLHCPILQSHGTDDKIIPCALGKRLFEAANSPKQFLELPNCGHNEAEPSAYYETLRRFLDRLDEANEIDD